MFYLGGRLRPHTLLNCVWIYCSRGRCNRQLSTVKVTLVPQRRNPAAPSAFHVVHLWYRLESLHFFSLGKKKNLQQFLPFLFLGNGINSHREYLLHMVYGITEVKFWVSCVNLIIFSVCALLRARILEWCVDVSGPEVSIDGHSLSYLQHWNLFTRSVNI